jgi:hypothetical protein
MLSLHVPVQRDVIAPSESIAQFRPAVLSLSAQRCHRCVCPAISSLSSDVSLRLPSDFFAVQRCIAASADFLRCPAMYSLRRPISSLSSDVFAASFYKTVCHRPAAVLLMPWVFVASGGGLVWSAAGGWRYNRDPPWWDHTGGWVRVAPPADGWQFHVVRGETPDLEPPPPSKRRRLY